MMDKIVGFIHHLNPKTIILYTLAAQAAVKGFRDAIDTTPATDDTAFERFATIFGKATGYLLGFRPKK